MGSDRDAPTHALIGRDLGPYRVDALLGQGAMGAVFAAHVRTAAHGLEPGERVALKTLRDPSMELGATLARLEREGRVGSSLRHPNLVTSHGVETHKVGGQPLPVLVMELVVGETLEALSHRLGGAVPEELCRHIGRELARGLAAVHAAGIAHRDVKPTNVLITADHTVKLVDFGIARSPEQRESRIGGRSFSGSLAYSAPEQLEETDAAADGAADLWSVGVLLYELAAGAHPFEPDRTEGFIDRLLHARPTPLGEAEPQISPFFEELVHALLDRDPRNRLGPASDVAEILDIAEDSDWWRTREAEIRRRSQRPVRRVRIPRECALHGRDAELRVLRDAFADATSGAGRMALVEGEAGIGKTRVVDEFLAELIRDGADMNVLIGRYDPDGDATAAGALTRALLDHFGQEQLEEALARHLADSPTLVPTFAARVRGSVAPEGSAPLSRDATQAAFADILRSLARQRTTLLWIDDLHFAPERDRGLLAALALAIADSRVLLVVTARPNVERKWVHTVTGLAQSRHIAIERLDATHSRALVSDSMGSDLVADDVAPAIAAKSGGNPFFALELLAELRRSGRLRQSDDGVWHAAGTVHDVDIPSSLFALMDARLATLDEDARQLLNVAACVGFEFDPLLVGDVVGERGIQLLSSLSTIERKHGLIRSVGRALVFDHHQIQEALVSRLSDETRQAHHAEIAAALETRADASGRDPKELDGALAIDLCRHFLAGAQGPRALRYLHAALDAHRRTHRNAAAIALATRALDTPGLVEGAERLTLLLRTAVFLRMIGRSTDEEQMLLEALPIADVAVPADSVRVRVLLGTLYRTVGRNSESLEVLDEAVHRTEGRGDFDELSALNSKGLTLNASEDLAGACALLERARNIAIATGLDWAVSSITGNLGRPLAQLGDYERALGNLQTWLESGRKLGNRRTEAAAHGNIAFVLIAQGRFREAAAHAESCSAIATEIGFRSDVGRSIGLLGSISAAEGQLDDAIRQARRCVAIRRENQNSDEESTARTTLAAELSLVGSSTEADEQFAHAVSMSRATDSVRGLCRALRELGLHEIRKGAIDAARAALDESENLARELSDNVNLSVVLVAKGALARSAGESLVAEQLLREAIACAPPTGSPDAQVLASIHLSGLSAGTVEEATQALDEHAQRMRFVSIMEAHYLLYAHTDDHEQLAKAYRRLGDLRRHAGDAHRDSIIENVALHRAIAAAAAAQGIDS